MYFHFHAQKQQNELVNEDGDWIYHWEDDEEKFNRIIGKFKKLNLFVGSNNCGKSRFLRSLMKIHKEGFLISTTPKTLTSKHQFLMSQYSITNRDINYKYRSDLSMIYNKIQPLTAFEIHRNGYSRIEDAKETLTKLNETHKDLHLNYNNRQTKAMVDYLAIIEDYLIEADYVFHNKFGVKKYIPILRSIHVNNYLTQGNFKETIKLNYGIDKNVFTGLELFDKVLDLKNSPGANRKKIKHFEKFLSKNFFENKEVEITSNQKGKELLFSIDDLEYPIYDLGDGIQSLIVLLFPIFTSNKNDWFFIEEPETNLHPGMQRIFIQTLLEDEYLKSKNLKYFFTSHSNHFLDITLLNDSISIFQFQKNNNGQFRIKTNVKPDKDVLDILGVNTSSVFLANTSIWVEGPTDRKYISKLLKLYSEHVKSQNLKEDIDFAFFEYGGNLIEHYLFDKHTDFDEDLVKEKINSFSLSNKIFLLADNDNVDMRSAKGKRRKTLEEAAKRNKNFYYQNTELKEIENLLPQQIIRDFLKFLVKNSDEFNSLDPIDFVKTDYDKIGLGEFYENLLLNNNISKKHHKSFKADSGTLKNDYKIKLADFAINSKYDYLEFIRDNPALKKIVENLYKFINI